MAWSVTLNNNTYSDASFSGNNYANEQTGLPAALRDFVVQASNILISSTSYDFDSILVGQQATVTIEKGKSYTPGTLLRAVTASNASFKCKVVSYDTTTGSLVIEMLDLPQGGLKNWVFYIDWDLVSTYAEDAAAQVALASDYAADTAADAASTANDVISVQNMYNDLLNAGTVVPTQTGQNNKYLFTNGTIMSWSYVDLSNGVTGTLPVDKGGTGKSSWTSGKMIYSSSSTTLENFSTTNTLIYTDNSGNIQGYSLGTGTTKIPYWTSGGGIQADSTSLNPVRGGTGRSTDYTVNGLLYSATSSPSSLSQVTPTNNSIIYHSSTGVPTASSNLGTSQTGVYWNGTSPVGGTLPTPVGGTGRSTWTANTFVTTGINTLNNTLSGTDKQLVGFGASNAPAAFGIDYALPTQNAAGKFLYSNGSNSSFEYTSKMLEVTMTNANVTLTAQPTAVLATPGNHGYCVILPATGSHYIVNNTSLYYVSVVSSTDVLLGFIAPNSVYKAWYTGTTYTHENMCTIGIELAVSAPTLVTATKEMINTVIQLAANTDLIVSFQKTHVNYNFAIVRMVKKVPGSSAALVGSIYTIASESDNCAKSVMFIKKVSSTSVVVCWYNSTAGKVQAVTLTINDTNGAISVSALSEYSIAFVPLNVRVVVCSNGMLAITYINNAQSAQYLVAFNPAGTFSTPLLINTYAVGVASVLGATSHESVLCSYVLDGSSNAFKQFSISSSTTPIITAGTASGVTHSRGPTYWNDYLIKFTGTSFGIIRSDLAFFISVSTDINVAPVFTTRSTSIYTDNSIVYTQNGTVKTVQVSSTNNLPSGISRISFETGTPVYDTPYVSSYMSTGVSTEKHSIVHAYSTGSNVISYQLSDYYGAAGNTFSIIKVSETVNSLASYIPSIPGEQSTRANDLLDAEIQKFRKWSCETPLTTVNAVQDSTCLATGSKFVLFNHYNRSYILCNDGICRQYSYLPLMEGLGTRGSNNSAYLYHNEDISTDYTYSGISALSVGIVSFHYSTPYFYRWRLV